MDPHDTIQPLLTDYVLGELGASDRRRVDVHLAECPSCAAEAADLGRAFQSIGLQEDPVAPPPHLRARVLESLARHDVSDQNPVTNPSPQRRLAPWLAVAAGVILALGALLALSLQRTSRMAEALDTANAEGRRLAEQIATTAGQADLAVAILTAGDMRRIDLAGFDAARHATARAYWSAANGLLVVADSLPPPPRGRVYQVWLIGGGSRGPVSAGVLQDPRGGRGMLIVPAVTGVPAGPVTVAVTDEPPGGLAAPTGGKHLVGS